MRRVQGRREAWVREEGDGRESDSRRTVAWAGCRTAKVLCDREDPCTRCVRLGVECAIPGTVPRGRPSRARLAERAKAQAEVEADRQRQLSTLRTEAPPQWVNGDGEGEEAEGEEEEEEEEEGDDGIGHGRHAAGHGRDGCTE